MAHGAEYYHLCRQYLIKYRIEKITVDTKQITTNIESKALFFFEAQQIRKFSQS